MIPGGWCPWRTAKAASKRWRPPAAVTASPRRRLAAGDRSAPAGSPVTPGGGGGPDRVDVLVAPAAQRDQDAVAGTELPRPALRHRHRVARLQGRDDALQPAEPVEGGERLVVSAGDVAGPFGVAQGGVLGTHPRVVEPRRDRVSLAHLPVGILEQVAVGAVEDSGPARDQRGGVLTGGEPAAGRLDPQQLHRLVLHEGGEDADGVAAP